MMIRFIARNSYESVIFLKQFVFSILTLIYQLRLIDQTNNTGMVQGAKLTCNKISSRVKKSKQDMVQGLHFELFSSENGHLRRSTKKNERSGKPDLHFEDEDEEDDDSREGKQNCINKCFDALLYSLGLLSGALMGICQPFILVMYGEYTTSLISRYTPNSTEEKLYFLSQFGGGHFKYNMTEDELHEFVLEDSKAFAWGCGLLALIQFITGVITVLLLNYISQKRISLKRQQFLKAVLRQDVGWHDTQHSSTSISASLAEIEKIKEGTGEKAGIFVYLLSSFIFNVVISFFYGWKLTLVMTSLCPIFIGAAAVVAKMQSSMAAKESDSYSRAGGVAEEVLSAIRTVTAFGGEEKEIKRFEEELEDSKQVAMRNGIYTGLGTGITWALVFCSYTLAFWYGTPLILADRYKEDKDYSPGVLAIVLFGVTIGAMNIGYTSPYIEAFVKARNAVVRVDSVMSRKSKINPFSRQGKRLSRLGDIEFKDVYFNYPARPNVKVLQGLNLKIKEGESVALVGSSGSGKSTTIQLLERFYDPDSGMVLINGTDTKELEVGWLRSQIGLVGQEPVLFNASIAENICGDLQVTHEEMVEAAKSANAHDFIVSLPKGYDTIVGEGSSRFSGGQKQRIAIARALVRKPAVLLLDEATSALDAENEVIVQAALERVSRGRTTLTVSHRLSAIRNVDRICVIQNGRVAEQGSHDELMEKKGHYYHLVFADAALKQWKELTTGDFNEGLDKTKNDADALEPPDLQVTSQDGTDQSTKTEPAPWKKLIMLNKPEAGLIMLGSLGAFAMGLASPFCAVLYGTYISVLALPDDEEVIASANWYSLGYLAIALLVFICVFIEFSVLGVAGARITHRLRVNVFSSILKQDAAWFDNEKCSVGILSSRLSTDANAVQGATGSKLGALLQGVSTLGVGSMIAVWYSWKMTAACIAAVPVMLGSLVIEAKLSGPADNRESLALEQASRVAVESAMHIRTVASLGRERAVLRAYCARVREASAAHAHKSWLHALVFAIGNSSINFTYAFAVLYGGYLIRDDKLPFQNTIVVAEAIVFGAWMVGQVLAFVPNISAARMSATRLFEIIERKPQMYQPAEDSGPVENAGDIQFAEVEFAYPKRPNAPVLNGLSLRIREGERVALVGPSGCGKSTAIQLLQRYYDTNSGLLTVGGKDVSSLTLSRHRAAQGIVSQEPVLFNRTIAENIAYGDNSRVVPVDEVIDAAKKASIHEYITALPAGYETRLGARGFQLSGGQKQRIAIARALVRNPRLLILDEATSALDTQSEKLVQDALEDAMKGRTCVIIAHRLSTVTNCDTIYVLSKGRVIESGTHAQLVARNQHYARLLHQQSH
ncbi:multidrug resistance protein homolog 49 isoform X2 [Nilaparvata lugens]|uniref:multidrug resistance protein homolog 49 isoform X2 n=1 Tax=Nilaparvata lugens TaxID=108931 RepID=UPI00193DDF41|nr:multidrug resistance protein homolog 49 isoform X2 [Nilaparvata lugens]